MKQKIFIVAAVLFFQSICQAQASETPPAGLYIEVPLYETPTNSENQFSWPSMNQSLFVTADFYQGAHLLIERTLVEKGSSVFAQKAVMAGFDFLSFYLPLGSAWMHEEWHRAVMSHRGISSYNDVYHLKFFGSVIAVSHVEDRDLIKLKKEHPADMVRLSAAGLESETELNLQLEKEKFFNKTPAWNQIILWANTAQNFFYINTCNSKESTKETQKQNSGDGSNMEVRDFTGLDCLGWVYDLFRPDEPYEARGMHPSGVGINRYRTLDDLTEREKSFLNKQQYLTLLNFADPFLFRFYEFEHGQGGEKFSWNMKLQHFLTSFGYDVDILFFYKKEETQFLLKLSTYFNDVNYFPGVSLENIRWPVTDKIHLTSTLSIWMQPENQRYDDSKGKLGGGLNEKIYYKFENNIEPFVFIDLKEKGWVAGNVNLESGASGGVGIAGIF